MLNKIEYQVSGNTDKPVNGVVYYFLFIQCVTNCAKVLNKDKTHGVYLLIFVNRFIKM